MLMVVAIVSLIGAISFPSVTTGLDSVRLSSASDDIAAFLNAALNRAERRREPVEVIISKQENRLIMRSVDPGWERRLAMPDGVRIDKLLPLDEAVVVVVLYPGGSVPRAGVEIVNQRGARRIVRIAPITGAPEVQKL